ncbi:MAG: hypothetical protein ACPGVN_02845 [Alphaproteobacteria bacterium]
MARRRQIKNIADGIQTTFISRNNDICGYWAIGKLCKFASELNTKVIEIDFNESNELSSNQLLTKLVEKYCDVISRMCLNQKIPVAWLRSVKVEIAFEAEQITDPRIFFRGSYGKPFIVTVSILDDFGRLHKSVGRGLCAPHDPNRELRSTRYGVKTTQRDGQR